MRFVAGHKSLYDACINAYTLVCTFRPVHRLHKRGLHFIPLHIHLSSHMHAITNTQVIIEGFILFKHTMPLISGHITYIHIIIEFNNIYYAESNSKIVADSILRGCFVIKFYILCLCQ